MSQSLLLLAFLSALLCTSLLSAAEPKPRLIVTTDIGGDPDDQQSLVRLLLYSNEIDIEALVATASGTPGELKSEIISPHLIHEQIDAYESIRANLVKHASGYPTAPYLRSRVAKGNPKRNSIGNGHDTEGSNKIIQVVDAHDSRPVNISIWGGQTAVAQALWRVKHSRNKSSYDKFISKIRIHDIGDQDKLFSSIMDEHPQVHYVLNKHGRSKYSVFRGMYVDGDTSLVSRDWVNTHVNSAHGPLGALYPWPKERHLGVKEGDTPSWFHFMIDGLQDANHPNWGGWGGRFLWKNRTIEYWADAADAIGGDRSGGRSTVWRWREHYQNAFQARLDWCVQPFSGANHEPLPWLNGTSGRAILRLAATPGSQVHLSAAGSTDPDGDKLSYRWFQYEEAGTADAVNISGSNSINCAFKMPANSLGKDVHIILQVTDDGRPRLTRYRRAVITGATGNQPAPSIADLRAAQNPVRGTTTAVNAVLKANNPGPVSWQWEFVSVPSGAAPSISGNATASVVFDKAGVYTIRGIASGAGGSDTKTITVTVQQTATDLHLTP